MGSGHSLGQRLKSSGIMGCQSGVNILPFFCDKYFLFVEDFEVMGKINCKIKITKINRKNINLCPGMHV